MGLIAGKISRKAAKAQSFLRNLKKWSLKPQIIHKGKAHTRVTYFFGNEQFFRRAPPLGGISRLDSLHKCVQQAAQKFHGFSSRLYF